VSVGPPGTRRWPSGNPRLNAFCRSAPAVRFMAVTIFLTGDLLRECALSSRTSAFDHERRLWRATRFVAISHLSSRPNWDIGMDGRGRVESGLPMNTIHSMLYNPSHHRSC
jgi:hypothetical protein